MSIPLIPCPFCGYDKPHIERYGTPRVSTIYECGYCGCRLETGEEFDHGRQWNERAQLTPADQEPIAWYLPTGHGVGFHYGSTPPKCELPELWRPLVKPKAHS